MPVEANPAQRRHRAPPDSAALVQLPPGAGGPPDAHHQLWHGPEGRRAIHPAHAPDRPQAGGPLAGRRGACQYDVRPGALAAAPLRAAHPARTAGASTAFPPQATRRKTARAPSSGWPRTSTAASSSPRAACSPATRASTSRSPRSCSTTCGPVGAPASATGVERSPRCLFGWPARGRSTAYRHHPPQRGGD